MTADNPDLTLANYPYGLFVTENKESQPGFVKILHIVGYKEPPTQADIDALYVELQNEAELGLTHLKAGFDYIIQTPTEEGWKEQLED